MYVCACLHLHMLLFINIVAHNSLFLFLGFVSRGKARNPTNTVSADEKEAKIDSNEIDPRSQLISSTVPLTRRKAYFNALKEDSLTFDM